ncbi:Fe-S oxidoreductase (plasmid) [Ensifer sp. WSM1721]
MPNLPSLSLKKEARRLGVAVASGKDLAKRSPEERESVVVFVPDVFTAHFDPEVALAAIRLARILGYEPMLAARHVNGKALQVHGYLAAFERAVRRTTRYLQELANHGVRLVGLDPSMTLAFRSEYTKLAGVPLETTL